MSDPHQKRSQPSSSSLKYLIKSPSNELPTPKNSTTKSILNNSSEKSRALHNLSIIQSSTEYTSRFSLYISSLLESKKTTITMSIVTLYALFADDIKTLAFPKSSDNVFSAFVIICLFLFSLELMLSFMYKKDYKFSFYFWLDFIATLSLITDIGWIWDSLIGVSNSTSNSKQLQNAGKASRAGTRTSRILRIIRLIRLIRLVKLYKNAQIALKNAEDDENKDLIKEEIETVTFESNVGKKLSEVTMKRVILIVLVMLFLMPVFEADFYFSSQTSWEYGLAGLNMIINMPEFEKVKNYYISYHESSIRPLVYLSWKNETDSDSWSGGISYNDLRYNEIYYATSESFVAIFDLRYDSKLTSLLNIFKTLFICIILTLGALYFTKDSEELVIKPIEHMFSRLKKISKNPIEAAEMKNDTILSTQSMKTRCFCIKVQPDTYQNAYETQLIENTIVKIGVLLALGFGEAGSAIINTNLERNCEIDSLLNGEKVIGIFGFCDIRNFTDTTEELREGVMIFVNEIAMIIHGLVNKYFGAANKNIGDAFLLVWKFSPNDFSFEGSEIRRTAASSAANYIPDLALLSFLKILAKINKDPSMLKYRNNSKLTERMPNYEVKMGFGLHLGWAIEGAIGSQFKIDASYLSPHINLASSLEGATKIYGVPLLISAALFEFFTEKVKNYCRKVDVVFFKGTDAPISLYTSDCEFSKFVPAQACNRKKEIYRRKRKNLQKILEKKKKFVWELFENSKEVRLMRQAFSPEFYQIFVIGIDDYISGNWASARSALEKAEKFNTHDGPASAILRYMSDFDFQAPEDWKGFRHLL